MGKKIQCPKCNGDGVRTEDKYDDEGNWIGSDEERCYYCHGEGRVDADDEYWTKRNGWSVRY